MAISEDKVKAPLFTLLSSARQEEETRQHALESLCNDLCQGSRLHAAPEPEAGGRRRRDMPDTDEETIEAFVSMDMDDPKRVMREFRRHLHAVEQMGSVRHPLPRRRARLYPSARPHRCRGRAGCTARCPRPPPDAGSAGS